MTRDPLENLLDELLRAHDRLTAAERPAPARSARSGPALGAAWRGHRRRTLGMLAATILALAASATAAVVIVTSSRPLAGRLPPQLLGKRYALRVVPDLQAGHAGWCVSLLDIRASEMVLPVPAACVSGRGPLIARGGIAVLSPQTGRERGRLLYAIVDRRVAALRTPDGTRIRPISSSELPLGWRAAVTLQAHPRTAGRRALGPVITLTPLGSRGQPLSAVSAGPAIVHARPVSAAGPRAAACRLRVRAWPGLRLGGASAVVAPLPRSLPQSAGFLTCYSVSLDFGGTVSVAALLVDAARPGSAVAPLPGFRMLHAHPRLWAGPAATTGGPDTGLLQRLYARRAGNAWLVLETPATRAMAVLALSRISTAG